MIRYTWADVIKTLWGIHQNEAPLRRAAMLIHSSLVDKKSRVDMFKYWPLPLDNQTSSGNSLITDADRARLERFNKRKELALNGN